MCFFYGKNCSKCYIVISTGTSGVCLKKLFLNFEMIILNVRTVLVRYAEFSAIIMIFKNLISLIQCYVERNSLSVKSMDGTVDKCPWYHRNHRTQFVLSDVLSRMMARFNVFAMDKLFGGVADCRVQIIDRSPCLTREDTCFTQNYKHPCSRAQSTLF